MENQTQAADDAAEGEDTPEQILEEEIPEVEPLSELEAAIAERDELHEKWLRAQADFQNLRRRTGSDIDTAVARAKSEVLGEAVTVLDYLDMALAAPVESEDAKNLKIGIEMTRGQLQTLFDRLSVKPIEAVGVFDPNIHQAVSTVETDEHEPGAITEVVRGGWMIGESVLRYAQVRVAAAPEVAEEAPEETSGEEDGATRDESAADEAPAPQGDA